MDAYNESAPSTSLLLTDDADAVNETLPIDSRVVAFRRDVAAELRKRGFERYRLFDEYCEHKFSGLDEMHEHYRREISAHITHREGDSPLKEGLADRLLLYLSPILFIRDGLRGMIAAERPTEVYLALRDRWTNIVTDKTLRRIYEKSIIRVF